MANTDDHGWVHRLQAAADPAAFLTLWLEHDLLDEEAQATLERYCASYRADFSPRMRHCYGEQLREVTALVGARPGARLLEVGCGCGTESLWLALRGRKPSRSASRRLARSISMSSKICVL